MVTKLDYIVPRLYDVSEQIKIDLINLERPARTQTRKWKDWTFPKS